MMKSYVVRGVVAGGLALFAVHTAAAAGNFTLSSPGFTDGGMLAVKNAGAAKGGTNCVGENVSPAFAWSNPPAGTKSFALLMFDPEGQKGLGVSHWVAYGIPAAVTGLAEGEAAQPSANYVGGKSTQGVGTYTGPCPPPGGAHHYNFTLIATDLDPQALAPGLTREELLTALSGHAKGATGLVGKFAHPG